ncbi:unnamed protein product [Ilex paraguariensis]|uniref:CSC1-like protein ERD4 n=1 Tax=Ilex paraguariensis TaxID=185542 RepID=A0ABC8TE59_9AQUA
MREALSSTEEDVISMSGVDSAVYFVFLSTVLGILVLAGLVLLPILLPVAATDHTVTSNNTTSNGTFSDLDRLSMGHVQEKSPRLWAFVIATYWVSLVAYYLLWKAYKHVSDLTAAALMSQGVRAEQFTVLVRDIPPTPEGQSRKEQIDSYFKTIYPEAFYRSMVVTDNKEVNKIYKELEECKKKLAHAEAVYAEPKKTGKPDGIRPMNRTGFLGLFGNKVDSIECYTQKINELTPKLEAEQKVTLREKQLGSALVFFTSRVTAASAAVSLHARMVDTWTVMDAPEPQQKLLPFLKAATDQDVIKTVLEAYLPQIALIVFLALLPKFLLFLSKAEGIPSESHVIRAASGKYFYFSVLNVFIGVTIGGTLFSTLKTIQKDPNSIADLLATSLPGNATFFLTFVALK